MYRLKVNTGSDNVKHIHSIQTDILGIDRKLLLESSKTVRGIAKFVDHSSVLMIKKDHQDQREEQIKRKQMKAFKVRHSQLNKSVKAKKVNDDHL